MRKRGIIGRLGEGTRELSEQMKTEKELKELSEWGNERGRKMDPLVKPEDDAVMFFFKSFSAFL